MLLYDSEKEEILSITDTSEASKGLKSGKYVKVIFTNAKAKKKYEDKLIADKLENKIKNKISKYIFDTEKNKMIESQNVTDLVKGLRSGKYAELRFQNESKKNKE